MGKNLILNESQFNLLLEALAVEPYLNDIRAMAEKCTAMATEFIRAVEAAGLDQMMYSELPEEFHGWEYDGDLDEETCLSYATYAGEIGNTGVNVVLIYRPDEYKNEASFNANGENGEIWLIVKDNYSVDDLYYSLAHEMTHAIDYQRGLCGYDNNYHWLQDDEDVPFCVRKLIYLLWGQSEFNAHQVDALKKADPRDVYTYWRRMLYKYMDEAGQMGDDDETWLYIWNQYIRPGDNQNITPKQARDYFMNRSWMLIDKFLRSISKKSYKFNSGT